MNRYILSYTILTLLFFNILSCSTKSPEDLVESDSPPSIILPEESLYHNAEEAYKNNQYRVAEEEYKKALSIPSLSTTHRATAYMRLAHITIIQSDYNTALSYLLQAITLQPDFVSLKEWYVPFEQCILFLSNTRALEGVLTTLETCSGIQQDIGRIYIAGAYLLWIQGKISDALTFAKEGWEVSKTDAERVAVERALYTYMQATNKDTVDIILDTVTEENKNLFPYNVFYLEKAIRYVQDDTRVVQQQGIAMLDYLRTNKIFVDSTLIPSNTTIRKKSTSANSSQSVQDIVFLLPLSSAKYKKFTQQIVNGAVISQEMIRRVDKGVRVHYINTEMKDWIQKLQRFPSGTIVGGPLRQTTFDTIRKYGLENKYIFLTFLQTLPTGVEGVHAWRFYNSQQDQIDALYRFGTSLGITSYGVLYPKDEYSNRMVSLFRKTASRYQSSVNKVQVYSGQESQWTKEVAQYLNTRMVNKQPVPNVSFRATFLPDSFTNATIIIPNLFYNGEQRQVIMGTSLWEERGTHRYTKDTFELAVYPTPFNPSSSDEYTNELNRRLAIKSQGQTTRWSALGFDFVRFAYTMNKASVHTVEEINSFLSREHNMRWVMAPMRWSKSGICRQILFIVTPDGTGATLVNMKLFAKELDKAYTRQNNRIKALLEEEEL